MFSVELIARVRGVNDGGDEGVEAQGSAKRNAGWSGLERSDDTGPCGPCALCRPAKIPREKHPFQLTRDMANKDSYDGVINARSKNRKTACPGCAARMRLGDINRSCIRHRRRP